MEADVRVHPVQVRVNRKWSGVLFFNRSHMPTLRHLVLLKFKEGVDKEAVAGSISTGLNGLPSLITFKSFTCGVAPLVSGQALPS